jgi:hypothetical protein
LAVVGFGGPDEEFYALFDGHLVASLFECITS